RAPCSVLPSSCTVSSIRGTALVALTSSMAKRTASICARPAKAPDPLSEAETAIRTVGVCANAQPEPASAIKLAIIPPSRTGDVNLPFAGEAAGSRKFPAVMTPDDYDPDVSARKYNHDDNATGANLECISGDGRRNHEHHGFADLLHRAQHVAGLPAELPDRD